MISVGVDIGGTFTDLVLMDETGKIIDREKVLTTSEDPAAGVLTGLSSLLAKRGKSANQLHSLIHATTLVANALIERRGAPTAFLTTSGFRDLLEMSREKRPDLYDTFVEKPTPLVPRRYCFGIPERMGSDGKILTPIDKRETSKIISQLVASGIESIAVCLLHSFRNPSHERIVSELVQTQAPHIFLSLSSEVAPEIREYQRAVTTVANAYVQPVVRSYLSSLSQNLRDGGYDGPIFVMLSAGGITPADVAEKYPVRMVESGPAAGVMAASFLARLSGENHVLSFDMGGTTAKICLVDDFKPVITDMIEVARVYRFKKGSGLPLKVPSVEVIEIGAGGGSIAHIDRLGLLKVGPQSAGAQPGPACYNLKGMAPTVTDADLILGYLDADYFLGGRMRLNYAAARDALEEHIAKHLSLDVVKAAWGVHHVVNANMVNAAKVYAADRAVDLRKYALIAFGGAGPIHVCSLAEQLGISRIIVPFAAGVTSAFGLLTTPPALEFARSIVGEITELDWHEVRKIYREMEQEGNSLLNSMKISSSEITFLRVALMRYLGQAHEITVLLPEGPIDSTLSEKIRLSFNRMYEKLYGRLNEEYKIEVITWRLSVRGPQPDVSLMSEQLGSVTEGRKRSKSSDAPKGTRQAYFSELNAYQKCPVYDRYTLGEGFRLSGPAIIEEPESTLLIRPGWTAIVDKHQNLALVHDGHKEGAS